MISSDSIHDKQSVAVKEFDILKTIITQQEGENMKQRLPAIIFVHGGGWGGGDKRDYSLYAMYFAE